MSEAILRAGRKSDLDSTRMWSWLLVVAVRVSIDLHRQRPTAGQLHRMLCHEPSATPSPEDDACDAAHATAVAGLVAALPERQLRVVRARAAGLGPVEIARLLGLSYKAVESLTSRARRTVRTAAFAIE